MKRKPKLKPQTTTLWYYPSQQYEGEPQGQPNFAGATPSYVIWNLLERYTREGDLVVDPFCGGGTTLDVARDMQRRALGYDVAPAREDIFRADARSLPVPRRAGAATVMQLESRNRGRRAWWSCSRGPGVSANSVLRGSSAAHHHARARAAAQHHETSPRAAAGSACAITGAIASPARVARQKLSRSSVRAGSLAVCGLTLCARCT